MSSTAQPPVHRITLFKIPSAEDQTTLLDIYRTMPSRAIKDVFRSVEDMEYYDHHCQAHAELKKVAKTLHKGNMMVYFQSVLP
ncbi:hypothetical protein SEUCBS139899_004879 [Sporothrix eucalyptigena]